ncbi:hypothetical protein CR513_10960, partial [Mucuna pruriens]
MKRMFLEKFFHASITTTIRKEKCGIRQYTGETLYECWERFNELYATCPHHQISEQLLIQYFYEEHIMMDKSMIDVASGGALMDKTLVATRNLISNMASNTQQFGVRGVVASRVVNENKITELTSLVRQLAIGQHHTSPPAKVCGICTSTEHPPDACPTLQETKPNSTEVVGLIGRKQYRRAHDQYSTMRYTYVYHNSRLANTNWTISHHYELIIPSQTILNPQTSVSAITLRSGKELLQKQAMFKTTKGKVAQSVINDPNTNVVVQQQNPIRTIPLPFPGRVAQARKFEIDDEILQTFSKVEINIPLLDAIIQIPIYARFLKELCINKRKKLMGDVEVGRNVLVLIKSEQVSTLIQPTIPKNCSDPSTFSVPCTIGKCSFDTMLDLGASTNVMPSLVYRSLRLGALEPTGIVIQLANKSNAHPLGILEDVLVQVSDMILPTDFYVLDIKEELFSKGPTLILGRPFLKTAKTKIDVHAGTLSMEFGDNRVDSEYNLRGLSFFEGTL